MAQKEGIIVGVIVNKDIRYLVSQTKPPGYIVEKNNGDQWRRQDFLLEGQRRMGSGAGPQKIFPWTMPSTLAVNATNAPFMD